MPVRHTIAIEQEDQRLRALIATGARNSKLQESAEFDLSTTSLESALATLCRGRRPNETAVLWAVGDRRIAAGSVSAPTRPAAADLARMLEDEARTIGVYSEAEELVIGYREHRGDEWRADFEAAPRSVVDEVTEATASQGIDNAWLMSVESVLAHGIAKSPVPTIVLDIRQDRARVLLATASIHRAARKFKLPFTLDDESDEIPQLLLPLVGEVHRSIDLFREHGLPAPERILPAGELAGMGNLIEQLREMLELDLEDSASGALHLVRQLANPHGWLVPALLIQDQVHKRAPCLLEPKPTSRLERAALLTTQLAGLAAIAGGVWLGLEAQRAAPRIEQELKTVRENVVQLEEQRDRMLEDRQLPAAVNDRSEILRELDASRISISSLLATIARNRPDAALLTKLRVTPNEGLEVTGVIRSADSSEAMDALGDLSACLSEVPGLRSRGINLQKEGSSAAGLPFRYSARIGRGDQ